MKRLLPFAPVLLLGALLLSPAAALAGAKEGLEIWWGRVFPALLPSFICVRLADQLGLLRLCGRRPRGQRAAFYAFSLVSGAPNGAKLLHILAEDGSLSLAEAQRVLPLVNNVSPVFLLTIIASGSLENKALFLPMGISFYGCILCLLAPRMIRTRTEPKPVRSTEAAGRPFSEALSAAIESSMLDMLRIGGCIVFVCTLLSLIRPILPGSGICAAAAGAMEVSIGASALGELSLPLRVKTSLMAGFSAYGGLSLALQTLCCFPELKLLPYLLRKLLFGAAVGLLCYGLFPLLPGVAPAFASRQEVLSRSLSMSALLLSSLLSLGFIGVLSLMVSPRKRN